MSNIAPVLIIAYGNPLRGDDGFAWHVAAKIDSACEVLTRHQLTPELAEPLSRASLAIFIDATVGRAPRPPAGLLPVTERASERLICHRIDPDQQPQAAFTHHVGPGGLLALARELYGASPEAYIVSAAAENFECGERLSPEIEKVVDPAVKLVEEIVDGFAKRVPDGLS